MIDKNIMHSIVEKLRESFPSTICICDVSGRVIVSTDSTALGTMNLSAIEALNVNSKVTVSPNNDLKKAGAAMPLLYQKSRIGAVVIEQPYMGVSNTVELLSKTIELLYQEMILFHKKQNRSQERDQFLFEWLHLQSAYTENFIKRGALLGINMTGTQTIILLEAEPGSYFSFTPMIKNLLNEHDLLIPLSSNQMLLILKEDQDFMKKYHRVLSASFDTHVGICSGEPHLNTAYRAALESLSLGKMLFPDEFLHTFEKMKLAITLHRNGVPGIEDTFASLVAKGKNASLAETAIAYIRFNGDIQKICDKLHIHRNSIPYRLRRIRKICGRDLTLFYDMLYIYASYIRYMGVAAVNIKEFDNLYRND